MQFSSDYNDIIPLNLRLKTLLSKIEDGVLFLDCMYNIININKTALKLLKIENLNEEANIFDNLSDDELKTFLKKLLHNNNEKKTCLNIKLKVENYYLQFLGYPLIDDGTKVGTLIIIRKRALDTKFRQLRENFVANVSHELKTPLTIINGVVENLLDDNFNNLEETKRFLKIIKKHAERLNVLISDILSLASIDKKIEQKEITLSKCNLYEVIKMIITLFEEKLSEKKLSISFECPDPLYIVVNKALIEQAISNLIDNAIKYNNEGGFVKVKIEEDKKNVFISVEDNGIGIKQKEIPRIFERFYRVDKEKSRNMGGTGLGLSIVKKVVKLHKGYITVKSKHKKGSTFIIVIPKRLK